MSNGRPRFGKHGAYTDKSTREYEQAIKDAYVASGGPKFEGPIEMSVTLKKNNITINIKEIVAESSLRGDR